MKPSIDLQSTSSAEENDITSRLQSCDLDEQLYSAVEAGNLDDVKELLTSGARVSVHKSHNNTCLHVAAAKGDVRVMDAILTSDPSAVPESGVMTCGDVTGDSALHAGVARGDTACLVTRLLCSHGIPGRNIQGCFDASELGSDIP